MICAEGGSRGKWELLFAISIAVFYKNLKYS